MKTANEILYEHSIDMMSMDDTFNTQLFHAMERYAEEKTNEKQNDWQQEAISLMKENEKLKKQIKKLKESKEFDGFK